MHTYVKHDLEIQWGHIRKGFVAIDAWAWKYYTFNQFHFYFKIVITISARFRFNLNWSQQIRFRTEQNCSWGGSEAIRKEVRAGGQ